MITPRELTPAQTINQALMDLEWLIFEYFHKKQITPPIGAVASIRKGIKQTLSDTAHADTPTACKHCGFAPVYMSVDFGHEKTNDYLCMNKQCPGDGINSRRRALERWEERNK